MLDLHGNPRYSLYDYSNGSYLIMDNYSNTDVEYSFEDDSNPYLNIFQQKLYLGINNYAYYSNDKVYDVFSGLAVDLNQHLALPLVKDSISDRSSFEIKHLVKYGEYFSALDGLTNKFVHNEYGDCGYVAVSILLGYYANFYDYKLVCPHYMYSTLSNLDNNKYQYFASPNILFKNTLKSYGDSNATIPTDICSVLNKYLSFVGSNSLEAAWMILTTSYDVMKQILQNQPTIIFGDFKVDYMDDTVYKHAIVGYGVTSDNHIIAHMGYDNRSMVMVKSPYLGFNGSQVHLNTRGGFDLSSSHYLLNGSPYNLVDNKIAKMPNMNVIERSTVQHKITCKFCGEYHYENHNFITVNSLKKTCSICGYTKSNNDFEVIGPLI